MSERIISPERYRTPRAFGWFKLKSCCCVGKMLGLDFFQSDRFRLRVLFTNPSRVEDRDWQGSVPAAGRHQSRTVWSWSWPGPFAGRGGWRKLGSIAGS